MKDKFSAAMLQFVASGFLLLGTGCKTVEEYSLTYRVWDKSNLRKFSEPATDPKLELFRTPENHEVFVQYDACSEKHDTVKRRAYYLQLNQARTVAGKKPRFVNPSQADGMTPIPVLKWNSANTNAPPNLTEFAVTAEDGRGFSLYQSAGGKESHELPVYCESSSSAIRIGLTPFAVAGDTVMVAAGLAVVCFVGLCESNVSFNAH